MKIDTGGILDLHIKKSELEMEIRQVNQEINSKYKEILVPYTEFFDSVNLQCRLEESRYAVNRTETTLRDSNTKRFVYKAASESDYKELETILDDLRVLKEQGVDFKRAEYEISGKGIDINFENFVVRLGIGGYFGERDIKLPNREIKKFNTIKDIADVILKKQKEK